MLTTLYPAYGGCRVSETEIGTPLRALLSVDAEVQAWLVGGYHGCWLPVPDAAGLTLDNRSLASSVPRPARACWRRSRPTGAASPRPPGWCPTWPRSRPGSAGRA